MSQQQAGSGAGTSPPRAPGPTGGCHARGRRNLVTVQEVDHLGGVGGGLGRGSRRDAGANQSGTPVAGGWRQPASPAHPTSSAARAGVPVSGRSCGNLSCTQDPGRVGFWPILRPSPSRPSRAGSADPAATSPAPGTGACRLRPIPRRPLLQAAQPCRDSGRSGFGRHRTVGRDLTRRRDLSGPSARSAPRTSRAGFGSGTGPGSTSSSANVSSSASGQRAGRRAVRPHSRTGAHHLGAQHQRPGPARGSPACAGAAPLAGWLCARDRRHQGHRSVQPRRLDGADQRLGNLTRLGQAAVDLGVEDAFAGQAVGLRRPSGRHRRRAIGLRRPRGARHPVAASKDPGCAPLTAPGHEVAEHLPRTRSTAAGVPDRRSGFDPRTANLRSTRASRRSDSPSADRRRVRAAIPAMCARSARHRCGNRPRPLDNAHPDRSAASTALTQSGSAPGCRARTSARSPRQQARPLLAARWRAATRNSSLIATRWRAIPGAASKICRPSLMHARQGAVPHGGPPDVGRRAAALSNTTGTMPAMPGCPPPSGPRRRCSVVPLPNPSPRMTPSSCSQPGGPEGMPEVMPFLRPRHRRARVSPKERLAEVAEHYALFGGVSPINARTAPPSSQPRRRTRPPRDRDPRPPRRPQRPAVCPRRPRRPPRAADHPYQPLPVLFLMPPIPRGILGSPPRASTSRSTNCRRMPPTPFVEAVTAAVLASVRDALAAATTPARVRYQPGTTDAAAAPPTDGTAAHPTDAPPPPHRRHRRPTPPTALLPPPPTVPTRVRISR